MNNKRIAAIIAGCVALCLLSGAIISACVFNWFGLGKKTIGTHQNPVESEIHNNSAIDTNFNNLTTNETVQKLNKNKSLPRFASYDEFIAILKTMKLSSSNYNDANMLTGDGRAVKESKGAAQAPTAMDDHSSTNTQVSGIDEGDIIKNDGKYIYISSNNKIDIIEAYPDNKMKKAGTITFNQYENVSEMYLKGNLLVAIGYKYEPAESKQTPTQGAAQNQKAAPDIAYYGGVSKTFIKVYNISDKSKITIKRELNFDGNIIASREKDGRFFIVTNKYISYYKDDIKPEAILPSYYDSAKGKKSILVDIKNIEYCPDNIDNNFLMVSVFDINNNDPVNIETVMGAGSTLYMSGNNMYIVRAQYRAMIAEDRAVAPEAKPAQSAKEGNAAEPNTGVAQGSTGVATQGAATVEPDKAVSVKASDLPVSSRAVFPAESGTVILKFNIKEKGVEFDCAGSVKGYILNQYSMDEFENTFRIATTSWAEGGQSNNIYVLDKDMKPYGKLENLAKGETIYAVRFSEKTAYVVTYRTMDPLFVIDLSKPAAPKVLGELKIPGFSNYLHPIGNNLMIGVGLETKELYTKDKNGKEIVAGAQTGGVKVSLFDVSNPGAPKELDNLVLGGQGSNSEVQYNPKAFLWWQSKSAVIIPVNLCGEDGSTGYDYSNYRSGIAAIEIIGRKLNLRGSLVSTDNQYKGYGSRSVYINNSLYLIQSGKVIAYNYDTMKETASLAY